MHINFSIDTANPNDIEDLVRLANSFSTSTICGTPGALGATANFSKPTQPQVVENSGSTGTGLILSPGASAGDAAGAEAVDAAVDAPAATRRGRKPKQEVAAPAPQDESAGGKAQQEADAEVPTTSGQSVPGLLTLDDVRAKLQAFTVAKGVPEGIALLKKFEAARISELPAEKYADFVKACEVTA